MTLFSCATQKIYRKFYARNFHNMCSRYVLFAFTIQMQPILLNIFFEDTKK